MKKYYVHPATASKITALTNKNCGNRSKRAGAELCLALEKLELDKPSSQVRGRLTLHYILKIEAVFHLP